MVAAGTAEQGRAPGRRNETLRRTVTALAFAIPAAGAVIAGPPYLPILAAAIAVVMAWEWIRVTGERGRFNAAWTVLAVLLVAAVAAAAWGRFAWGFALVGAALPSVYGAAHAEKHPHAASAAVGALYVGVPALALVWLYARPEIGRVLVVWLIAIVIAADIAAYFVGRAVRGPKLAPHISPGKTWSGAAGGLLGALAVGLALGTALDLAGFAVLAAASLGFAIISQIGDLLESGVKRVFRVKDAGDILPGHGGMMDRVDGIVAVLATAALIIWIAGGDVRPWL